MLPRATHPCNHLTMTIIDAIRVSHGAHSIISSVQSVSFSDQLLARSMREVTLLDQSTYTSEKSLATIVSESGGSIHGTTSMPPTPSQALKIFLPTIAKMSRMHSELLSAMPPNASY